MNLQRAVTATLSYSSFFHFPLFPHEVHHWLVCSHSVSQKKLNPFLPKKILKRDKEFRAQRDYFSRQKNLHAQKLVSLLKYVPGLRLVALTGSVAAKNSQQDDDIDLLFITAPHLLWLIRPLVIFSISLFFRRRHPHEDHAHAPNAFCPNLWLDTLSLSIPLKKRSLYTAHEVLQIVPLLDIGDTYRQFIKANSWTKKYLANAYNSLIKQTPNSLQNPTSKICHLISILFVPLNYLFYLLQLLYMSPKKTSEYINLHAAFLHTTDYSSAITNHLRDLDETVK